MNNLLAALAMLALQAVVIPASSLAGNVLSLAGKWHAVLGKESHGSKHEVTFPGSLLTNNIGDEPSLDTQWTGSLYDSSYYHNPFMEPYRQKGNMKFPFFLTPNRHYVGVATYTRKVFVPQAWGQRHITLYLERPHIETTVRVNGHEAGHQMSLTTPHVYDVTAYILPGRDNEIEVKVYNGIENVGVGQDSHSVTDQTQGNWNGITGRMELRCHGRFPVGNVQVFPDISRGEAKVVVAGNKNELSFRLNGKRVRARQLNDSVYALPVRKAQLWSEETPYVYQLAVCSKDDTCRTTFGMREISIKGMQFCLNDIPIWLRGTVENCTFPLTGYPPTDVKSWKEIFRMCKNYGLNAMRFHSYCPPEAAFVAADEMGIYLQPEGPSWPNHGVKMNRGMAIDKYLMDETRRMVAAYGNHPSFVMMSAGNEPAGDWVTWGNRWVEYWKKTDSRRVYCSFNVGGGWAWDDGSQYHVKGGARGLDWGNHAPQCTDDYRQQILFPRNYKGTEPNNSPFVSHEQGQWCAFPNLDERDKYTGVYKAYNYDIFADLLKKNGMEAMAGDFLRSSGRLQYLCYRFEIERNLRTRGYAGFMLLGLNDYSGQGTATVGPLDVFWKPKGYSHRDWRTFCKSAVVMAEMPKFVFTEDEHPVFDIDIYNAVYGKDLTDATLSYMITRGEVSNSYKEVYYDTLLYKGVVPNGKNLKFASLRNTVPLVAGTPTYGKYTLELNLTSKEGGHVTNFYDYWVYPKEAAAAVPDDIYMTDTLDDKALRVLDCGGKVLIAAAGKVSYGSDVKQTYLPVFWNTSWFKMRPPHTTGAYINDKHPLFENFPTDNWGNLNWWELLNKAQVMNLANLPADYQPPIQPIDTWHVSRKLGMLIEANVGNGKLLMTTMDITSDLGTRHVARQMRKAIFQYMESEKFRPAITLDAQTIGDFFTKTAPPVNMFTNDSPDELKPKLQ